jgi:hypothetical protein
MTRETYYKMLSLEPEVLPMLFLEQYQFEFGEKKSLEIAEKIQSSEKVFLYINQMLMAKLNPAPKDLILLMNSIPYFMFAKEETLCLGGLIVLSKWMSNTFDINNLYGSNAAAITKICADFIIECNENKYKKSNNMFTRLFDKIGMI